MKKDQSAVRNKWVTIRMNQTEFEQFEKFRKQTTERTNSNYLRKLALREPLTKFTRNQSLDEATAAIIQLKKEINYIGHNFNQVVHKLHTLDKIPEFRQWAEHYESTRVHIKAQSTNLLQFAHQILSPCTLK
jgi:vacuolar-type H+-ATPase subunit I/STV1